MGNQKQKFTCATETLGLLMIPVDLNQFNFFMLQEIKAGHGNVCKTDEPACCAW
jgi:hypothetical protein